MRPRAIPTLLIDEGGLVKTVRFNRKTYLGDPINAVRLFNDMEVDEIIIMDISATKKRRGPDIRFIREFAAEGFMPLCYGGGIVSLEAMDEIFNQGVEKVAVNHALVQDPRLLGRAARRFGTQSLVACLDVKKSVFGRKHVYDYVKKRTVKTEPQAYAKQLENEGAGEIFLCSVDRDGMMNGYDLDLIEAVSAAVGVPVVACGGASGLSDLREAVRSGAAAAAAGSMFVYQGRQKGVLINYPSQRELENTFEDVGLRTSGHSGTVGCGKR